MFALNCKTNVDDCKTIVIQYRRHLLRHCMGLMTPLQSRVALIHRREEKSFPVFLMVGVAIFFFVILRQFLKSINSAMEEA